jgi:hypothetical protein
LPAANPRFKNTGYGGKELFHTLADGGSMGSGEDWREYGQIFFVASWVLMEVWGSIAGDPILCKITDFILHSQMREV